MDKHPLSTDLNLVESGSGARNYGLTKNLVTEALNTLVYRRLFPKATLWTDGEADQLVRAQSGQWIDGRSIETRAENDARPETLAHSDTQLLTRIEAMIDGSYVVEAGRTLLIPSPGTGRESAQELKRCSNAERRLSGLARWLLDGARPGEMLLADAPEAGLHPRNQRELARLLARLANQGVVVVLATHSDYMIKEFNILMALAANSKKAGTKEALKLGYDTGDLIAAQDVRAHSARTLGKPKRRQRLIEPTAIDKHGMEVPDKHGMEVPSFDAEINQMNDACAAVYWKSEE